GNRRTSANELTTTSYQYDTLDRLTQVGAINYTNDANGNRTTRGNDTFTYDQANRLTRAAISGGLTTNYAYDGDGKRMCSSTPCTTPEYVYDVNRGLPVLLQDGARQYVWGLGLAYTVSGSAIAVHHSDGLGSNRAVTTATGQVESTYLSDDFGVSKLVRGTSPARLQYTGEPRDNETGFVYLRARMYDPAVGRFLQRDSLPGQRRDPQTQNRFSYVQNSPLARTDPSGHKSKALAACFGTSVPLSGMLMAEVSLECGVVCGPFGCALTCQIKNGPSKADPSSRDECNAQCEQACKEAYVRCEQEAWSRERRGIRGDAAECKHGQTQCERTGGCFLNPGWYQSDEVGNTVRPRWEQVYWGRDVECDTETGGN
ncbi:MAG: RHS repeat domain-containing protein, partial [Chloroflexota bacterium]